MVEVRLEDIKEGNEYLYRGTYGQHNEAIYYATVIKKYPHFVHCELLVDQNTVNEICFGSPVPYEKSVSNWKIGRTEHFYE